MKKQLILYCALALSSINAQEITKENWISHPKIKEIRKIFQSINNNSKLKAKSKACKFGDGIHSLTATIYLDSNNRVRKYRIKGGSDDSRAKISYYYSVTGQNRFTFQALGSVNGTKSELRTYFDEQGIELYEDYRLLEGPGYTGGFPDKYVSNPANHFLTICDE